MSRDSKNLFDMELLTKGLREVFKTVMPTGDGCLSCNGIKKCAQHSEYPKVFVVSKTTKDPGVFTMNTKVDVENGKYTWCVENGSVSYSTFSGTKIKPVDINVGAHALIALIGELETSKNLLKSYQKLSEQEDNEIKELRAENEKLKEDILNSNALMSDT